MKPPQTISCLPANPEEVIPLHKIRTLEDYEEQNCRLHFGSLRELRASIRPDWVCPECGGRKAIWHSGGFRGEPYETPCAKCNSSGFVSESSIRSSFEITLRGDTETHDRMDSAFKSYRRVLEVLQTSQVSDKEVLDFLHYAPLLTKKSCISIQDPSK